MDFLHDCAGFVFDMDGLLLDTERLSQRAFHAAADELGLKLPEDAFFELIGRSGSEIHRRVAVRVGEDMAVRMDACSEAHYQAFLAQGVPVKEGVVELLEWFSAKKLPCAVATSTRTPKAEHKLQAADLHRHFQAVVGGDQVVRGKPEPDIYLLAAKKLGVSAEQCGVFEDSDPGLRAAHAAGTRVVWVPDLAQVSVDAQKLARGRAESLSVVVEFLRRRN